MLFLLILVGAQVDWCPRVPSQERVYQHVQSAHLRRDNHYQGDLLERDLPDHRIRQAAVERDDASGDRGPFSGRSLHQTDAALRAAQQVGGFPAVRLRLAEEPLALRDHRATILPSRERPGQGGPILRPKRLAGAPGGCGNAAQGTAKCGGKISGERQGIQPLRFYLGHRCQGIAVGPDARKHEKS